LKFLTFRYHFKFSKFDLNKILHKFSSFWKIFKLLSKQWNSPQSNWITSKYYIPSSKHTLSFWFCNYFRVVFEFYAMLFYLAHFLSLCIFYINSSSTPTSSTLNIWEKNIDVSNAAALSKNVVPCNIINWWPPW